jgi:RHS repeat-associated protein
MKKILCFLIIIPIIAFSQIKNSAAIIAAAQTVPGGGGAIGPGPSADQNYIKTTIYKQANTTSVTSPAPSVATVLVTYFDGLGRPMQQIANQQSATGKDIIKPIVYDAFGRQAKDYLPYTSADAYMNYDSSATSNVVNYPLYAGQTPYSEKQFEASPLNRVLKIGSEGVDWDLPVSASDPDHTVKLDYQNNTTGDNVKMYKASAMWSLTNGLYNITLINGSGTVYYPANQLYKTVTKNENWTVGDNNTTQEFKDKNNRTVLRRIFDNGVAHDTYYVFDQFSNLTYIIPPLVTNTTTQMDGLCYQYKYDYRNRLVEKKLPGKQWQFIVYDLLNRSVATGPNFSPFSNLTTSGWLITKYDVFNRTVYTGWQSSTTITTAGRKLLQDAQNALTTTINETKLSSGGIDGIAVYYSNQVAPTSFKLLSVNYYDNYVFPNVPTIPTTVETQPILATNQVKSLQTGSWARTLTLSTATLGETNTVFYDVKARPIRVYTKNYLGGYTQIDTKLDFAGVPQYEIKYHKRLVTDTEIKTTDNLTYSPQGRLLTHTHQIGTGTVQLLNKNDYNEIGQLITKKVGGTDITGVASLQKIDYSYNIRGWLTGINDITNLTQSGAPQDLFAFKINFNTVQNETGYTGSPLYNGNVAETYWRTSSDNVIRKYGYQYDNLNRLKNAIYQKPGNVLPVPNSYNEALTYDKEGNITSLQRNGNVEGVQPPIAIDNLAYTYDPNSNKLLKVTDTPASATSGFKDGTNTNDDYSYDANGNMTLDQNKGITSIVYNHFNFPTRIVFGTTGNIVYVYNALGQKEQKIVTQGTTVTTTDYLSGYQYKNNLLQFFPVAEGYVGRTAGTVGNAVVNGVNTFNYVFQYKDHLGNARVSYTKNATTANLDIIEESHFYPFGLKHSGYNTNVLTTGNTDAQKYKFQGQERQDELGLNWDSFKWRNYDSGIGRFMSVDPLAEKYSKWTPYAFAGNQVVHSRELEGLEPENDLGGDERENYNSENHGVGFGDAMTDHNHYQVAFPMGGELQEVVIGANDFNRADESYGYDNGRYEGQEDFDNDSDGYSREDRANNERALEEMASNYQNIGSALTITGMVLSFTPLSPLGLALMASGSGLSIAGASISLVEDSFDGDDNFNTGKHIFDAASLVVPELYSKQFSNGIIGLDNLYLESIFTGSGLWMDAVTKP